MLTDGRTDESTNGSMYERTNVRKLACLCLPAKAGATIKGHIFTGINLGPFQCSIATYQGKKPEILVKIIQCLGLIHVYILLDVEHLKIHIHVLHLITKATTIFFRTEHKPGVYTNRMETILR